MAKKRIKKKRQENDYQESDYYNVLKEKVSVTVDELIKMIHRINPTGEDISSKKSFERYRIKTQLQSLLIRRFKESLIVEQPEPENSRLLGLRLRHFDKDACHAMIDDLDEDARAWAQRQIDEALTGHLSESDEASEKSIRHDSTVPVDYAPIDRIKKGEEDLTKDELIKLGQDALAEYDYEACERYYLRALKVSGDNPAPALFLLELYVDYLAAYEKAADLSNAMPISVKTSNNVKIFLALAAARSGRIDSALEHIKRLSHPRTSEVYVLSVKHLVQEGEIDRASNLLGELASFEQPELKPAIEQLAKDIQSVRAKSLEPVEQEMILAQQQGRTEDSMKLADRILSVSPENKAARHIRHEFNKKQRDEQINHFLRLADEARKNNDFSQEAELLNKAIASGANAENLAKRLEFAMNEARHKKEEMEIHSLIDLLAEGNRKEALLNYTTLTAQQRSHVNNEIHDPHLAWLDQILSTSTANKPEKIVEAVLVLGKSKEALKEKKGPEQIIAEMEPYAKVLQSVPEAHGLLREAERLLQAAKQKEAKDLLDMAAGYLEMEDPQKGRACINQIKVSLLQEDDKKLFDSINLRLHSLEKFMRLKQTYTDSHNRGDHFAARNIAGELAKHLEQDTFGYWIDKMEEHTSHIKREWVLVSIDIDELPIYYASLGLEWLTENALCCLLSDEQHLIIAASKERWMFLRIFSLDDQKFKKAIIFRTPKQMHLRYIYPVGNILWMTGENGDLLELGLEPLNILSWHSFSSLAGDEVIEGAWLFPKSKSLWLNKRSLKIDYSERIEIIDLDQQRVVRQAQSSGYPMPINAGGHFSIAVPNLNMNTVQVYSERGKPVESFAFEKHRSINNATLHPNGNDFVFLTFDDRGFMYPSQELAEKQQDYLAINIEVRPDLQGKYQPLRIENSSGELYNSILTSLDKGIIFIMYRNTFSEDHEYILAAFKETGQGFDRLYEVKFPWEVAFACDEFSRHVAAINFHGKRIQALVLNENPPVFDVGIHAPNIIKCIPHFSLDYYTCNSPTGAIKANSLSFMTNLETYTEKEVYDAIKKIKQPGAYTPDDIAAFIDALRSTFHFEMANDMKMWLRTQYPNYFTVLVDLAEDAGKERRWPEVISLLNGISRQDLDDGMACHICHLLGIAYFIQGEIERAQSIWMEGITYEDGKCDLDKYIEYAELSLMPAEERKKQKSDMANVLNILESVDHHLANKRWLDAIKTIEKNDATSKTDLQILSRLTWAYLNQDFVPGNIQWLFKIIALGNYCEVYDNQSISDQKLLPPYIEIWSQGRLSDIARQAKQWLGDL